MAANLERKLNPTNKPAIISYLYPADLNDLYKK